MKILAVECSDKPASCAVVENGIVLCESYSGAGLTHSRTLMPMIESMLLNSEINIGDIDAVAVSAGPGSFTGLRIGIAAAKGLAYGLGKKCIAVPTLDVIAASAKGLRGIICASMDARCSQVYNAVYYSNGAELKRLCDDRALMIDELKGHLVSLTEQYNNCDVILVGSGSQLVYNSISKDINSAVLADSSVYVQRACQVGILAERLELTDAENLLPVYLRLPQAERELKKRTNQ